MAKSIEVTDLDIYYGDFLAVEGVSMRIPARSVTALIGPSGCGKSTFLRSLNRMHELVPGARVGDGRCGRPVHLRRRTSTRWRSAARSAWCSSSPNPFPTMSIYDNVLAGPRLNNRRMRRAEADDVAERALRGATCGTRSRTGWASPGDLSGGQQQRLCIARALAVEPRGAADGRALLGPRPDLHRGASRSSSTSSRSDYTIVIVTHNMQQAARVSRRPPSSASRVRVGPDSWSR